MSKHIPTLNIGAVQLGSHTSKNGKEYLVLPTNSVQLADGRLCKVYTRDTYETIIDSQGRQHSVKTTQVMLAPVEAGPVREVKPAPAAVAAKFSTKGRKVAAPVEAPPSPGVSDEMAKFLEMLKMAKAAGLV
jgi:hypothetical protein